MCSPAQAGKRLLLLSLDLVVIPQYIYSNTTVCRGASFFWTKQQLSWLNRDSLELLFQQNLHVTSFISFVKWFPRFILENILFQGPITPLILKTAQYVPGRPWILTLPFATTRLINSSLLRFFLNHRWKYKAHRLCRYWTQFWTACLSKATTEESNSTVW